MNKYKYMCKPCGKRKVRTPGHRCRVCRSRGIYADKPIERPENKGIKLKIAKIDKHLLYLSNIKTKNPVAMWETISYWKNKRNQLKQSING